MMPGTQRDPLPCGNRASFTGSLQNAEVPRPGLEEIDNAQAEAVRGPSAGTAEREEEGALYIRIVEKSEDMVRFYFQSGEIYHVRYGSAIGNDCLDILQFYSFETASFYEGISAPDKPAKDLPSTDEIIARFRKAGQSVKTR